MRILPLLALAVLLAATGCARNYVITTHNGARFMTASKPKLEQGNYVFKDASGKPAYISAGRVKEVSPASMVQEEKPRFNPSVAR
ncbi:MAG TPA: YgdI/YgdR family lipoprotein [Clostridia bacterium]|nr:YgdI/YgdR family lipoprotein [Clostridia bacterium]